MRYRLFDRLAPVCLALCLMGCGQGAQQESTPPSTAERGAPTTLPATFPAPTVTAAPLAVTIEQQATGAPATGGASAPAAPGETPFAYRWPSYLPAGLMPAPDESRIARDGELGPGDIGFFIVTFNGGARKLIIGGGAAEALALSGRISNLSVGDHSARLVTNGDQSQLIVSGYQGALFVYGVGIAMDELVRVAESLEPIDVNDLRERVGVTE